MTEENNKSNSGQTIYINQEQKKSNGIGTAGFIIALVALFLGWIPIFGWILWVLGVVFSFIGVFKSPRGLSIAGLVISFIGVILIVFVFALLGIAAAAPM